MVGLKTKAEAQEAFHRAEKAKLEEDLRNFRTELKEVTNYQQALEAAWIQSRQRLSELYRTNLQLAEDLKRLQFQMSEEINKRTLEATAQSALPP
jgi:predicted nuclease with TOPRIM domain